MKIFYFNSLLISKFCVFSIGISISLKIQNPISVSRKLLDDSKSDGCQNIMRLIAVPRLLALGFKNKGILILQSFLKKKKKTYRFPYRKIKASFHA